MLNHSVDILINMQDYTIHFLFKIFLSFGLFLILNSQGSAQNIQKIDSLKALIANSSEKDKIKILNELGWEYRNSHFLEALEYINQAITLAEPIADYEHLSQSYNFKGVIYRNLNVNRQAMESFYKALKIAETHQIDLQIAYAYNNIGDMYYQQEGYSTEAIKNIQKAIVIFKKIKNTRGLAYAYLRVGEVYRAGNKLDSALIAVKQSLVLREKIGKDNAYATSLQRIGEIYLQKNQIKEALDNFEIALNIFKEQKDIRGEVNVLISYATIYQKDREYSKAKKYTLEALKKANSYFFKDSKRNALKILYELAQAQGDYRLAFEYQTQFVIENDSLANQDINELVAKLNALNDLEKKETQLALLRKDQVLQKEISFRQNILILGTVIALLLISIVAFLLFRSNQQKQKANNELKKQKEQIEQKSKELLQLYNENKYQKENYQALAQELAGINRTKDKLFSITSHDMRSPLNSLKGLLGLFNDGNITNEEMREMTKKLELKVNTLSEFLDNLLNWSKAQMQGIEMNPQTFDLSQVIEENILVLSPQAQEKQIIIHYKSQENIFSFADPNLTSLILRNLISNAIKFTHNKGDVSIEAITLPDFPQVEVRITDNGIGLEESRIQQLFSLESYTTLGTQQETGTGLGLLLSKEFIEKQGGKIKVESKKGEGSIFSFTLPTSKKSSTPSSSPSFSLQ